MAIAGNLAKFSLPELFHFLEYQQGTGLLWIYAGSSSATQERRKNYVWLQKGRIVAVADRLDNRGLTSIISQRGWLKFEEIRQIVKSSSCCADTPLGMFLKDRGALTGEQLKLLFYVSVLLKVCALFKLKDGQFAFDNTAVLPREEMTGMSLSATEATLLGLRVLRDWGSLAAKLPAPDSVLCKASAIPHLQLDSLESQVWQLVNGKVSVRSIAKQLNLSPSKVQQIACRLSMVGLVEEVSVATCESSDRPQAAADWDTTKGENEEVGVENGSPAFLHPEVSPERQFDKTRNMQQLKGFSLRRLSSLVVFGSNKSTFNKTLALSAEAPH